MPILKSVLHQTIEAWRPFLLAVKTSTSEKMPNYLSILIKKTCVSSSKISLKPLLTILYAILILFVIKINFDQLKIVNDIEKFLSIIPENSTILSSFNQQYQVLFVRPDLKIIPSSEIGMPSPKIRNEYIDFFKLGSFRNLASKTSAGYMIEAKDMYLNPIETQHLELIGSHDKLSIWKILDSQN
jgi:hypothetical protein